MLNNDQNKSFTSPGPAGFPQEANPLVVMAIAILVGMISSLATVGFIKLYQLLRKAIYLTDTSNIVLIYQRLPWWAAVLFFTLGGALLGLFTYFILPHHGKGHGLVNFLKIYREKKKISLKEGLGATMASSFSISLGASVGREAPIMYFSASIANWICQLARVKGKYLQVMMACAVATALATSLHSTFFALFFILEVAAYSMTAIEIVPIALAVISGTIVREFFPEILPPTFWQFNTDGRVYHMVQYLVMGILLAFSAIFFMKSLQYTQLWHSKSKLPNWIWPILGGVGLGLIGYFSPISLGLSFEIVEQAKNWATPTLKFVIVFLVFKFLATYLSLGFGFSGGILTPCFIIGLLLGTLYYIVLTMLLPDQNFTFQDYALGGSAIFTAAVINAPVTMAILAFELTHDLILTSNVFAGIIIARLILRLFKVDSIYHTQYELSFGRCENGNKMV